MPKTHCVLTSTALVFSAFSSPPAHAEPSIVEPLRFASLERDYEWDGKMRKAEDALGQTIPPGTSFWTALDTLKAAGARCAGDVHDPRLAKCAYSERITINDYYPADAVWTVIFHLDDGKAGRLMVSREIDER